MKQHITKEQWNELDWLVKTPILNQLFKKKENTKGYKCHKEVTIGQMIEFLGDDLKEITFLEEMNLAIVKCVTEFNRVELADNLWEAVKYKLNK